ncbi:hypothetical protein [Sinomicrobium weinanense]|uniref:Outer membrane protein beta-barrel domain-containing protein n=1 Tax=Sinomicrobium weinanense TaxID=2842200 RepID=A0A926Q3V3_9FLAO|nr:hypothetical protein [Sinomicrobium weinanense]MBC9796406.1 hypothetical protein [Sinomicrobium weinanense]MBU3122593.1 hypothetical protein [Sinomicrobium weinanense]
MKKLFVFLIIVLGGITVSQAQLISPNALGLRIGDSDGFGAEISYQRALKSDTRLELDLGWRDSDHVDAYKLTALHQWVWNIDGGFNWFAGAGGGIGSYDYDYIDESGTFLFAAGDIGIEYNFDIPLVLSLDMRPELGFTDEYRDDLDLDIALGIRFQF